MRHWTEEERARQAELIKQWKPWERSTGARTAEGKTASSQNALVHGGRSQETKKLQETFSALTRDGRKLFKRIIG